MDIDKASLDKANAKIKALVLKILKTKRGGNSNKTIQKRTGKLKRTLDAFLRVEKDNLFINIKAVNYYKYLDKGSNNIKKPWFLTKELTESKEFKKVIKDLLTEYYVKQITK